VWITTHINPSKIFVIIVSTQFILMDNNFSAQVKEIISFSREEALRLGMIL
jgi:hypothetical protein